MMTRCLKGSSEDELLAEYKGGCRGAKYCRRSAGLGWSRDEWSEPDCSVAQPSPENSLCFNPPHLCLFLLFLVLKLKTYNRNVSFNAFLMRASRIS